MRAGFLDCLGVWNFARLGLDICFSLPFDLWVLANFLSSFEEDLPSELGPLLVIPPSYAPSVGELDFVLGLH